MTIKRPLINPQNSYIFIMLAQLVLLFSMLIPVNDPMVFLLFIFTVFSMVIRWRFSIKPIYMLIDETIIISISISYSPSYLCLFIIAYYFAYKNKFLYMAPLLLVGIIFKDTTYYLLNLQAIILGILLHYWSKDTAYNIDITDRLRRRIYELELVQSHLLLDHQDIERMSRLKERQRIAEVLHDNLGHELTAAHLSLKAYKTLLEYNRHDQAQRTLEKIEKKIEHSLEQLKDSVKHIEPIFDPGFADLISLIENYVYPINFSHSGQVLELKSYIWQLILMSTKEALTNITKHAKPKNINIGLDVTNYIVRLVIENDGLKYKYDKYEMTDRKGKVDGNGLRYMRSRLEAINGSLSIQKQDTFKLIIIIPIDKSR